MLKRSRWLLLKRPEKLTGEQRGRLAELVRRNLRTVRAYLLKEDFQSLWGYVSPYWAGQFLDRWCTRTMRSRLDPMKEVARMVALAPRPDSELVPSPGAVLQWRCRRLQRKGQSDHQTGVWVPHLRGTGSRFVSRTWRPARTKTHPQILLTRPEALPTVPRAQRGHRANPAPQGSPRGLVLLPQYLNAGPGRLRALRRAVSLRRRPGTEPPAVPSLSRPRLRRCEAPPREATGACGVDCRRRLDGAPGAGWPKKVVTNPIQHGRLQVPESHQPTAQNRRHGHPAPWRPSRGVQPARG